MAGQCDSLVGKLDYKAYLNRKLVEFGSFTLPPFGLLKKSNDYLDAILQALSLTTPDAYPIIGEPVRGRGVMASIVFHHTRGIPDRRGGNSHYHAARQQSTRDTNAYHISTSSIISMAWHYSGIVALTRHTVVKFR